MIIEELTRRTFLQGSGTFVGSTLMRAGLPLRQCHKPPAQPEMKVPPSKTSAAPRPGK